RERQLSLLVSALARCGPVGIKWGQWASTRYDLFEEDFCEALGTLTNAAPAHGYAHSRAAIEAAFGQPLGSLFDSFDEKPVASGSIGQARHGTFRDASRERAETRGDVVAVKVQRPNLGKPRRTSGNLGEPRRTSANLGWVSVARCSTRTWRSASRSTSVWEQAENLERFAANFSSAFWRALVSFPRPIAGLVSREVLAAPRLHLGRTSAVAVPLPYLGRTRLCGTQAYFKMLIWDNYIHADLHPGNLGLLARVQRYLLLGDFTPTAPHIVFLDAGLAASFDDRIFGTAQSFFDAVTRTDGPAIGKAILGLAPTQPYGGREAFISEVAAKCTAQKEEMDRGEGRPGDNIRAYMDSVRSHRVVLDPTVMVALMSMLVLEGWQYRLDPAVSIFHCLE
ncbi:aarF domain-containing protein, partial [Emiliania huxleyi CCMP1516]|uniref:ABC1 atypical kinase-like domain-containing protein n=2 Tax=Emiliania huxleyi TaxID=2903 RepID=A0A0D3JJC4_EMIH1